MDFGFCYLPLKSGGFCSSRQLDYWLLTLQLNRFGLPFTKENLLKAKSVFSASLTWQEFTSKLPLLRILLEFAFRLCQSCLKQILLENVIFICEGRPLWHLSSMPPTTLSTACTLMFVPFSTLQHPHLLSLTLYLHNLNSSWGL